MSSLLFSVEEYCLLGFNWPAERRFVKAPQGERALRFQLAEWIRCILRERIKCRVGYCLYPQQAAHHKKFSYQEEIREIMKRHRVAFDERYLWD
ncbi:MAG TPA: hypothetical protein VN939_15865 [Chthoniobacterales bacterium]|nr:hypothetical protein [Chthoniobacterales bacterium]